MQLTKAQIEQVRYQLKRLEATATYDEVRNAAEGLEEFDASVIADKILVSRTTEISTESEQIDDEMLALLQPPQETTLTTSNQEELTTQPKPEIISFNKLEAIEKITSRLDCKIGNKGVMLIAEAFDNWIVETREQVALFEGMLVEYITQNLAKLQEENLELVDRVMSEFEKKVAAHGLDLDEVLSEVNRRTAAKADANKSYILSRFQTISRRG